MSYLLLNLREKWLLIVATLFAGFLLAAPLAAVNAQNKAELCAGANLKLSTSGSNDECTRPGEKSNSKSIEDLIAQIINVLTVIVGIVAVIMIIIGGFKYITSGGDSGAVSSAKNTVIYAIVGLIIVAFAQIIVRFVINKAT